MGISVIGGKAGSAEPLPFGAATLLTSGFVNGLTFDYTASVPVGRYIIEGSTQDGASPIVAYAPNSDTTAIAYPGKSAILSVTTPETVIRISAMPAIGKPFSSAPTPSNYGTSNHMITAAAQNANGSIIVQGINYFAGGSWQSHLYTSTNSGSTWSNSFSTGSSAAIFALEFVPSANAWLAGFDGYNNVYRSTDGLNWNVISNIGGPRDFYWDASGNIVAATGSGLWRSTNGGSTWSQVFSGFQMDAVIFVAGLSSWIATSQSGRVISADGINWTSIQYNDPTNNTSIAAYSNLAQLKNSAIVSGRYQFSSAHRASGFIRLNSQGRDIHTVTLTPNGNTVNWSTGSSTGESELTWIVKNYENRGFVLAVGLASGVLALSVDGLSWFPVGAVSSLTSSRSTKSNFSGPKMYSDLLVPTAQNGVVARYTNSFAYKIYTSSI